jgi:hypothetical protein
MVALGGEGVTIVLDAATRRELRRIGHSQGDHEVAFLPDGRLSIVGSSEGRSVLWDARSGAWLEELPGSAACARSHRTTWFCRTVKDGVRFIWDGRDLRADRWDGRELHPLWVRKGEPFLYRVSLVAAASASSVATAGEGGLSRTATQREIAHFPSADGKAVGSRFVEVPKRIPGGFFRLIGKESSSCEILGLGKAIRSLGLARRNSNVLLGDASGLVFHVSYCKLVHRLEAHRAPVIAVAVAPTAHSGISVDETGRACWWDLYAGRQIQCRSFALR